MSEKMFTEKQLASAKLKATLNERVRLTEYLVDKGIIRLDAFGYWVRDTMGDEVTELPGLNEQDDDYVAGEYIRINTKEIGAMLKRAADVRKNDLRLRLYALREVSPAGSEVSIELTKWVRELD